ncbi:NAD(P)/FAD-dependent oxidoreductase [Haloarcula nitratireducens]|uniref:FAD-dependent monooxygenase n=1 Tax=Haloarcula nitratireducens TaxID=2487749 RepID=A0AAW4PI86_9EURY|nr:NAD(P)/FAD-dependent oxidoreductase [Halomicroarcula nitratireducens]MBX0297145.1 FAD-dependent monooxygenase [Halomicroarcula nitratireducens]
MTAADERDEADDHCEVVIVGGGPAGCSAGVFTARYGLDTVIFDRGNSSLARCAHLQNYLGFPGGIDVETFLELARDHADAAGCDVVDDMVETVEREGERDGEVAFRVETQDGETVTADRVVAATRYGGEYLRPLGGDAMFETREHGGEDHEHFDPDYADDDGRTPVDGLYVASPAGERDVQAVVAAGQGAHVARTLLAEWRRAEGLPEGVLANHYDWLRPDSEFEGEWNERERWRERFDEHAADAEVDDERLSTLRERAVDRAFETRRSEEEIERLTDEGHRRLAEHLDPDDVVEAVGSDAVLDAVDDERIREYLEAEPGKRTP